MELTINTTPPPPPPQKLPQQLLTPPASGGAVKRMRFLEDEEDVLPSPKRLPPTPTSEKVYACEDIDNGDNRDNTHAAVVNWNINVEKQLGSFINGVPPLLHAPVKTALEEQELSAPLVLALEAPASPTTFNFMGLPVYIRKKVYDFLLTVPALVCVRQKRTPYEHCPVPYSNENTRQLLPGISFVLIQKESGGMKARFHRSLYVNSNMLLVNKKIHIEAMEVLYGDNVFELSNLTNETVPPADFRVHPFPRIQRLLIKKIAIRGAAVYRLKFMLLAGYKDLKKTYPNLESLTLLLEMESTRKGYGKYWSRRRDEGWVAYIKRLKLGLAMDIYGCDGIIKTVPTWLDLRVVFHFENYMEGLKLPDMHQCFDKAMHNGDADDDEHEAIDPETVQRSELKRGIAEAFELLKKGRRH